LAAGIGVLTRRYPQAGTVLAASLVSALVFYFATNTISFITSAIYPKTAAGFLQAQWTGPVGAVLPTWVFLRNLAAANLLFTACFLLARKHWSLAIEQGPEAVVSTR
ncbi:MAG: DUF6580 family putative transport protein, partial [Verrucomicrobiota bacterium]